MADYNPFTINIKIPDLELDQFYEKFSTEKVDVAIRKAHFKTGEEIFTQTKKLTKLPKTGRRYYVYKNGRRQLHIASAPGEPWAHLEGDATKTGTRKNADYLSFVVEGTDLRIIDTAPEAAAWDNDKNPKRRPTISRAIESSGKTLEGYIMRYLEKELE